MSYQFSLLRVWLIFPSIIIATCFTAATHAALISINGQQFDGRGATTFDLLTKLEWLDVSATKDRSFNDVQFDLTHEGGFFNPADGWRYAYGYEIQELIARVFARGYQGGYKEIPEQYEAVANFVNLFGDTWTDFASINFEFLRDTDALFSVGRTNGFFAIETALGLRVGGAADINDNQFIMRDLSNGEESRYDMPDYIWLEFFQSHDELIYETYHNNQLGSWLVRDRAMVPEPSMAALLLIAFGFLLRRRISNAHR